MFCCFAPVTRHSFQAMCTVFSRKDFFRLFDGLLRISTRKTNAEPRCLTSLGSHDGAIWAAKYIQLVHVHHLVNPYTDLTKSLWGTKYFLWETNSVFWHTTNSLQGTFRETNDLRDGNRNLGNEEMVNTTFCGYFYLNNAFLRSVPGLQYDNIVHVHTGHTNVINDLLVNTITDSVNQCIKHSQLCKKWVTRRVRDREPSRILLRRVKKSLNRRKLRSTNCWSKTQFLFHLFCIVLLQIINDGISNILTDKIVSIVVIIWNLWGLQQHIHVICQTCIFYCQGILN